MTLAKAKQLVELACSTEHAEEARTAALAAARLIKRDGLLEASESTGSQCADRREYRAWKRPDVWDVSFWDEMYRSADYFNRHGRYPPRDPGDTPKPATAPTHGTWGRVKVSKRCEGCGKTITVGERAYRGRRDGQAEYWCEEH